jgi:16S rRNA (uracil1498-N3)-methyltransferase
MKLFFGDIFPTVKIDEDEQQHIIKVLRMRADDEITVTDGKGNAARGNLVLEGKKVTLGNIEVLPQTPEFAPYLHIAIAPTKNIDRTEFFVEKATELGISEITFILSEKSERRNMNFERIQKQIIAASKQSLRFHFPKVNNLTKLSDFVRTQNPEETFVAHCDPAFQRLELNKIPSLQKITFLIGPEGDFSPNEIKMLATAGVNAVSLGSQRLRTETAGTFVAAWNYGKMI